MPRLLRCWISLGLLMCQTGLIVAQLPPVLLPDPAPLPPPPLLDAYRTEPAFSPLSIGLCLISPIVAYRLGVARGENNNENDGAAELATSECALRALTCNGSQNSDCVACLQLPLSQCTTVSDCTSNTFFCTYTCP